MLSLLGFHKPLFVTIRFFCVSWRRQPIDNLTPEERDARTVFCMQLAARIRARDLEDFFSAVGKVRFCDVFRFLFLLLRYPKNLVCSII